MGSAETRPTKRRITFARSMLILKYTIAPMASWPLPPEASASDIRQRNIWWWCAFIISISSTSGWYWSIYLNLNDFDVAIKAVSELFPMSAVWVKMIVCKIEASRLQDLMAEMNSFLKNATAEEWELVMQYYDSCFTSHSFFFISSVLIMVFYIFEPAMNHDQTFPGTVEFPFAIESFWVWATLYLSQIFIMTQCGSMLLIDLMYATLLWYASARFDLLAIEFSNATNEDEFKRCIKKHQELMEYFVKFRTSIGRMAVVMIAIAMTAVSTGGFVLIRNQPMIEFVKYILFEFVAAIQVLLFSWPSDHILQMGEKMRHSIYNCAWIGKSPRMLKDMIIVLQRAKNPPIITIEGFLPILSLEFFGNCVAASFSYIATLRAVAGD
ncbi:odorant receptor 46a-like [Athalia rosae]|uniref:odorant receptor 46a-like n=1 Tax=Athalia rosae TaxID=37344 RepID=UPI00203493A4|nr:odorant receptor 46a-like [Athalia rosae]